MFKTLFIVNVCPLKIFFLFITILIAACLGGCGEISDMHISDMHIEYVDIIVAETHKEVSDLTGSRSMPLFSVTVRVYGVAGPTTCYGHHKTDYLHRDDYAGQPLYRDGDTIHISISASGPAGSAVCGDAVSMHKEAIFVGFCVPGDYTLHVNHFIKTFRVGSEL